LNHKALLFFALLGLFSLSVQNLIPSSPWTVGTAENVSNYSTTGSLGENVIENGVTPYDSTNPIWRVIPNNVASFGGFQVEMTGKNLDIQQDYRYSIWVKIIDAEGGKVISLSRRLSGKMVSI